MGDTSPWSRLRSEVYSFFGRNPKSNRRIVAVADLDATQHVLDIGCGPGAAVRAAAAAVARAVGVDRSKSMIEIARRRSGGHDNVGFQVAAAEQLPFPNQSFDRVWTIHAFHHWEEPEAGLAESLRVLRPGGEFLIIESEASGSHGVSAERAAEIAVELERLGFAATSVSKPHKQIVVTAIAPEEE